MRMMRWFIPLLVLMTSSLACFATASDDDDSSVPMVVTRESNFIGLNLPTIEITPGPSPTFFTPTFTPGPSPTPYPTTDPALFEAFATSSDSDEAGGISAVVPLVGLMVLAFGLFAWVIRLSGRQSGGRRPKSE